MSEQHGNGTPPMSDEFQERMRRGLSTMAVRERSRERTRNRAIAGGAVAAAVVAAVAIVGAQALLGGQDPRQDQAAPPAPTEAPLSTPTPPTQTEPPVETPVETEPAETGPPPGFEGVAAGEPIVVGTESCDGCGDAGAAGDYRAFFDLVVLCEGVGGVAYNGMPWIDCTTVEPGTGIAQVMQPVLSDAPDPVLEPIDGFTGQLQVVPSGEPVPGDAGGSTATVYFDCTGWSGSDQPTIGGSVFDCGSAEPGTRLNLAAWGVPIEPGRLAPTLASETYGVQVRFVVDR